MRHPFDIDSVDLELLDLDFEQSLTDEDAEQVGGGLSIATTQAIGEEGGFKPGPFPLPRPIPGPYPKPQPPIVFPYPLPPSPRPPIKPPVATTLAIGEEGGGPVYTKALWENG